MARARPAAPLSAPFEPSRTAPTCLFNQHTGTGSLSNGTSTTDAVGIVGIHLISQHSRTAPPSTTATRLVSKTTARPAMPPSPTPALPLVDFSGSTGPAGDNKLTVGSIAGAGVFRLGANELTVGSNNLSTEVSGVITGDWWLVGQGRDRHADAVGHQQLHRRDHCERRCTRRRNAQRDHVRSIAGDVAHQREPSTPGGFTQGTNATLAGGISGTGTLRRSAPAHSR